MIRQRNLFLRSLFTLSVLAWSCAACLAQSKADSGFGHAEQPADGPVPIRDGGSPPNPAASFEPSSTTSAVPAPVHSAAFPTEPRESDEPVGAVGLKPAAALPAVRLINEGVRLAMKGAMYSARVKFIDALEMIADSLDAENQTQDHSRALSSAVVALRETNDFGRTAGTPEINFDPVTTAAGHVTPVLKDARPHSVTRLKALQLYFSYATREFRAAIAGTPEGSMALCYLGRLQPFICDGLDAKPMLAQPKAIALYQAAILADPKNYRAVNELGVIFAQCGQYEAAKKALLYSVSVHPQPETLKNLAVVCQKLGDTAGAKAMRQRSAMVAADARGAAANTPGHDPATSLVYWVDHKTFAGEKPSDDLATAGFVNESNPPLPPGPAAAPSQAPASVASQPAPPQQDGTPQSGTQSRLSQPSGPGQEFLEPLAWDVYAQGEYIGPAHLAHVPQYFLRVDDVLVLVFRIGGKPTSTLYRLNVGDVIHLNSVTNPQLNGDSLVQPDGTIVLPQIGQIFVAGKTLEGLRSELDRRFREFFKEPSLTITPISINKVLEELRNAVINRNGIYAGQALRARVSPDGTIQMPGIGSVPAQALSMAELQSEIEARYAEIVHGLEVTVTLSDRAPRALLVLGEVRNPGRFELASPTTVIQSIAMAGGWNIGGNLRQVIVLRRDESWRLMATRVNVKPALYNHRDLCADDIWLRDSDIVIVPKQCIQVADDLISLWLTKGLYSIVPFGGISFSFGQTLGF